MKRNISDIMHNADDETIERIADKKQAADSRTSDRIYRKCISRLGTDAEQVEVFEAETVRRAPRFYPVFAAVFCLIIICGSVAAMLKFKAHAPLPEDNDPQIMATVTTVTETTEVTGTYITAKTSSKTDAAATSAASADDKTAVTEKTSAANSVRETDTNAKTVTVLVNGTTAKKTTASKTAKTSRTTTTTTAPSIINQKQKLLTTKDIIELAKKGDALTWSDFEGYIHEDVGSGLYIWEFKIEEGSGYTLRVGGVPPQKPSYIMLYRGINTADYPSINGIDTQNGTDIRYGDVSGFIDAQQKPEPVSQILGTKLRYGSDLIADGIQSLEVSNTIYNKNAAEKLTYDQIKQILPLIMKVELIEKSNSYQTMSINYSTIKITTHNGSSATLVKQGGYFIIDGEGYKAESASMKELDQFINTILANAKAPENIDLSGHSVWCWHDFFFSNYDMRNLNESIKVSAFPDTTFSWVGMDYGITIYKNGTAAASFGGMPLWSAYFTDLNGDGSPELCMTVSFGSGMVDEHIIVYDLRNEKEYALWERMEYDYVLFMENNELFVRKTDAESLLNTDMINDMSIGEKGRLKINGNDKLVFDPVS